MSVNLFTREELEAGRIFVAGKYNYIILNVKIGITGKSCLENLPVFCNAPRVLNLSIFCVGSHLTKVCITRC